jgi:hypothetical protein
MSDLTLDSFTKIGRPTRTRWAVLGRRNRQVDARAERQRLAEIEIEREAHYRRRKSEASALRNYGKSVPSPCGAECPVCHPPAPEHDSQFEIRDLREGRAAAKRPTGKTGTCRLCGKPCPKRCYYHRSCRLQPGAAVIKRTPTCLWDAKPLTGGQTKWCSRSCQNKAYRAKLRPAG